MKKFNFLSNLWSLLVGSRKDDGSTRYRLVIVSLSTRYRVWQYSLGKIAAVVCMLLTIGIGNAWGDTWTKVTAAPDSWAGEYLIVYQTSATGGVTWTGADAANCNVSVTISDGVISTTPNTAASVTIAAITNGYSIKVNAGTLIGKYIGGTSGSNTISNNNSAILNTISYETDHVEIVSNTSHLRYNNTSNNYRFRYFKSTSYSNQQVIQLYKKDGTCEQIAAPTVTATPSSGQISLSWADQTGASSYNVTKTPAGGTIGTPTKSGSTWTCNITGLTNGTTYTWNVTPVGDGSTYCASGNTAASGSATPNVYYTVTWMNNGSEYTTTSVVSGSKPTFPARPTSCESGAGASTTFVGWTKTTWTGKKAQSYIDGLTTDATKVHTSNSTMSEITANGTVYHAVFALGSATSSSITSYTDGTYYLIDSHTYGGVTTYYCPSGTASGQISSVEVTSIVSVTNGVLTLDLTSGLLTSDMQYTIETVEGSPTTYTIYNASTEKYIGASTNTSFTVTNTNKWEIATSGKRFMFWYDESTDRAVLYQHSYNNSGTQTYGKRFGCYAKSNAGVTDAQSGKEQYGSGYLFLVPSAGTYSNYMTGCCTKRDITLTSSGSVTGGTFESDMDEACNGETVTLTAHESTGYEFGGWSVYKTGASSTTVTPADASAASTTFTMPAYAVTVNATFNALTSYSVTWMVDGTTWSGKGGSTTVYQGRKVSDLPTAPNQEDFCGDKFVGWTTVENYVHGSSPLYKSAGSFPNATGDQTFYAVFADINE